MSSSDVQSEGRFRGWWARRLLFRIPIVLGGLVIAAVLAFLLGLLVMLLWNWVMPDVFGLPQITYWQGWALVLLAHILFKTGGNGGGGPRGRHGGHKVSARIRGEVEQAVREEFGRHSEGS